MYFSLYDNTIVEPDPINVNPNKEATNVPAVLRKYTIFMVIVLV